MPTYTYRREDGTTFEIEQRITEPSLATCPTTGQSVVRVITGGSGLVFKGSGFYLTDYARKNGGAGKSAGPKAAGGSSESSGSSSGEKTDKGPSKETPAPAKTGSGD